MFYVQFFLPSRFRFQLTVWSISLLSPSLFAHILHNRYLQTFTRLSASQIFSASHHRCWCAARRLSEMSIICSECSPSLQPHPQTSLRTRTTSPTPPIAAIRYVHKHTTQRLWCLFSCCCASRRKEMKRRQSRCQDW